MVGKSSRRGALGILGGPTCQIWKLVRVLVSCKTYHQEGAPKRGGVSFSRRLKCGKVRFLGWVRSRVSLGGRSTCVDA